MLGIYIVLILLSIYIIYVSSIDFKKKEFNMFWLVFFKYPLGLIFKFLIREKIFVYQKEGVNKVEEATSE